MGASFDIPQLIFAKFAKRPTSQILKRVNFLFFLKKKLKLPKNCFGGFERKNAEKIIFRDFENFLFIFVHIRQLFGIIWTKP
jgi:hypothetical protein